MPCLSLEAHWNSFPHQVFPKYIDVDPFTPFMLRILYTSGSFFHSTSPVSQHTCEHVLKHTHVNINMHIHTQTHTQHHGALREWFFMWYDLKLYWDQSLCLKYKENSPLSNFNSLILIIHDGSSMHVLLRTTKLSPHTCCTWGAVRERNGHLSLTCLMCQCLSGSAESTQLYLIFWCCCCLIFKHIHNYAVSQWFRNHLWGLSPHFLLFLGLLMLPIRIFLW